MIDTLKISQKIYFLGILPGVSIFINIGYYLIESNLWKVSKKLYKSIYLPI